MTRLVKRQPGRPVRDQSQDVKSALTAAARELFARHGYDAVSLRRVASAASVNPAMIHYYFGDKDGLYEAVVAETIEPLLARLQGVAEASGEGVNVRAFLDAYLSALAANPWLPALMLREVLPKDGRLRERFTKQFAARGAALLQTLMRRGQQEGLLRQDLDPKLASLSLISLALFPFLGAHVAGAALGLKIDDALVRQLLDHTEKLFLQGTRA